MVRVGVFIDALEGSLPGPFREKISAFIQTLPEVVFCVEEWSLHAPEALKRMVKRMEEEKAEGAVIVGASPKAYEASFEKSGLPTPGNPYRVAVANVREQALWTAPTVEAGAQRANGVILKALRAVSASKAIDTQSLSLKPEVLVIGGGAAGITVALELARAGIHVSLIDRAKQLGGRAQELRRFYDRPEPALPWVVGQLSELQRSPNISLFLESHLRRLDGHVGRFQATIQHAAGKETLLSPSAVVVAAGCTIQPPEEKGIYGHKRVIPLSVMERLLSESQGSLSFEGKPVQSVSYLLDRGNEDVKIDSIHAIKQALILRESFQCQVTVFCREIKVAADGVERLYRKARERGTLFFKTEAEPKLSMANDRLQVDILDTAAIRREDQWSVSIVADLVVVSDVYVPDPETERLRGVLGIPLGPRGFLMSDNPQFVRVRSNRRGIFVAGACRFPQELSESLIEAKAAAQEVISFLSTGFYTYDLAVAEVDPKKCAVCYTCPRLCPHAAITVEKYAEKNIYAVYGTEAGAMWGAAKVDPAACYGCGICVAECPARAITLHHLPDEQIFVQMGL